MADSRWHIVVATDLSPASAQAHRHALQIVTALAPDGGARLTLLTVEESRMDAGVGGIRQVFSDYFESVSAARDTAMSEVVASFERHGVKAETAERGGTPFRAIASFAQEEDADLVILARHTRSSPIPRRLLGSTVQRLLRVTTTPVLVVPVDDGVGDAVQAGVPTCDHILAPTDLGQRSSDALEKSAYLAERLGATVTALHVVEPLMWVPLLTGATLPPVPSGMLKQNKDAALAALAERLPQGGATVMPTVVTGFAGEKVCKTARQVGADWIALGTTGKGATERLFLGSTAGRVVRDAHVPVLIWPSTQGPCALGSKPKS